MTTASTDLISFAEQAARLVGTAPGVTAYSYATVSLGGIQGPSIDLTGTRPYAFTDCSSWVN